MHGHMIGEPKSSKLMTWILDSCHDDGLSGLKMQGKQEKNGQEGPVIPKVSTIILSLPGSLRSIFCLVLGLTESTVCRV